MAGLEVKVDTSRFSRMVAAFERAGVNVKPALGRALNHTGVKACTQVSRALVKQTGLKYARVRQAVSSVRTGKGGLVYRIISKDGWVSLKEFGAR
jgi:hypothetical protein